MSGCMLLCSQCFEQEISGGITETVFPKTEKKLNISEYQEALQFVAKRKNMERYRSMMDFLFCESFTVWRFHAFRFYNGQGLALKAQINNQTRKMYDVLLCDGILELCVKILNENRLIAWSQMRQMFTQLYLKAA